MPLQATTTGTGTEAQAQKIMSVFIKAGHEAVAPATIQPGVSQFRVTTEAKRSGFIGICEVGHWKAQQCEAWMQAHAGNAERMVMVGSGALAPFLIRAHLSQRPIRDVSRVDSRSPRTGSRRGRSVSRAGRST